MKILKTTILSLLLILSITFGDSRKIKTKVDDPALLLQGVRIDGDLLANYGNSVVTRFAYLSSGGHGKIRMQLTEGFYLLVDLVERDRVFTLRFVRDNNNEELGLFSSRGRSEGEYVTVAFKALNPAVTVQDIINFCTLYATRLNRVYENTGGRAAIVNHLRLARAAFMADTPEGKKNRIKEAANLEKGNIGFCYSFTDELYDHFLPNTSNNQFGEFVTQPDNMRVIVTQVEARRKK